MPRAKKYRDPFIAGGGAGAHLRRHVFIVDHTNNDKYTLTWAIVPYECGQFVPRAHLVH